MRHKVSPTPKYPGAITRHMIGEHRRFLTRTEPIRKLKIGESVEFVVDGYTHAASVRCSAYGVGKSNSRKFVCERIEDDLVKVTRVSWSSDLTAI